MWDFSLANYGSVWSIVIQILLLLVFLVLGNILRRSIPFLRKSFIPSALIGGVLLALVGLLVKVINPDSYAIFIDKQIMKVITYHCLAIGFIATTLKVANKDKKKGLGVLSIQNGLLTGATYMLQAVFGLLTVLVFWWAGSKAFYASGIILPLAFGQGPGNAMTWDINFAIADGSFGLALASIGFIVASVVGVIYLNIYRRKGEIVRGDGVIERRVEEFVENHEIEDSDSIDKMSVQVGIVAISYAAAFGIMCALHATGVKMVRDIAWGFNFIFGVITATLIRALLVFLNKKKVLKHKYINNYQMDRISGLAFDLMIIAGVAAIEINKIKDYIWILIALTIVGTIVTLIYVRFITKRCFKGLHHHMFLVNFGTLTGTASNGMILLREVDSSFETQSSNIFIVSQFPAMIAVAPLLLLTSFAGKSPTNTYIALGIFFGLAIVYTTIILLLQKKVVEKQFK